jgi:hypothetical protein
MVAFSPFTLNSAPKFDHFNKYLYFGLFGFSGIVRSIKPVSAGEDVRQLDVVA